MGKVRPQLSEVEFRCPSCRHCWTGAPASIEDAPEEEWHPWRYSAPCPICREDGEQHPKSRSLLKAWASATGPTSEEGKRRSAANLSGHPTPEEARRTRFNALKHGLSAQVATYFPARPGSYPHCEGCEYRDNRCWAAAATAGPCLKRTELYFEHHLAFETKNPEVLRGSMARLQAHVSAIIEDIILAVIKTGVEVRSPQWYYDKEGSFHLAEYVDSEGQRRVIQEVRAHPLLKVLTELLARNGMTLLDSGMTLKAAEDKEAIQGSLSSTGAERESLLEHQERQTHALERLGALVEASRAKLARDPVLLEHQGQTDERP